MTLFLLLCGFLSYGSDVSIKGNKILYENKELHPGCLREITSRLNGDVVEIVENSVFI